MKRFMALSVSVVTFALLAGGGVLAEDEQSMTPRSDTDDVRSYVVIMDLDPAVAYDGGVHGYKATKPSTGQKIKANSADVRRYRAHLKTSHDASMRTAGVGIDQKTHDYTMALNGYSALLTDAQVSRIKAQKDVVMVVEDELRQPLTDSSPSYLGLTAGGGPWARGYDGEGVVVGVLDTGIWPEHPSFADDGSFPPPPIVLDDSSRSACDFGNTSHNPNDAPYVCNNKLIGARQMLDTYRTLIGADPEEYDSARDDSGHGTLIASTVAGNRGVQASIFGIPRGAISGIAPRAHTVAYKVGGALGGFSADIVAGIDQAVADGVDVISYGFGGGASLTGADDIAFLFAADAGVFVATGAGNSGPGPGTIGGPASVPWITAVGASTQSRFWQGAITLGDGSVFAGASVTPGLPETPLVDAEFAGGDLCIPGTLNAAVVAGKIVLCRRGTVARADKSRAVFEAGGVGTILYDVSDEGSLFADTHWTPAVHVDNTPGLAIKAYIASSPSPTASIECCSVDEWPFAPSMGVFSSRGPNLVAPDIIKPDIIAPGVQILGGWSPTPIDDYEVQGQLFHVRGGTSIAQPQVAGVGALLKQAHPDWSPAMIKSALMTTAHQDVVDNDRVSSTDVFDVGAGHIRPGGRWNKGSVAQPGLVYDAGFNDYLGFLCDAEPEVFVSPETCDFLDAAGVPTDASDLNLSSMGIAELAGSQTVHRTVTSVAREKGWRKFRVSVEAPSGYEVTVSPSTFKLRRGDTATYSVTITNVGAPVGEWRFGSLTWQDKTGHYSVYSPIAVRGSLFGAPAEINGTGESGSESFDVAFGYTGSYAAAPHGLVSAVVTSDNVPQDPDQTFDPADGFSNAHAFALLGAAHFRVVLPPEGTEPDADLDIFLQDPVGSIVAFSTSGGTDEQIDIHLPMDGTWTVWVHGWAIPDGDADYDMWTWAVPLASGGSLTIDAAPTAATLGAVGTIDVSWTGLTSGGPGDWYLGAVSHTGDVGLMGLTLIDVDNR